MTAIPSEKKPASAVRRREAAIVAVSKIAPHVWSEIMPGVKNYFTRYGWPKHGSRILVALSGGPDSVALLHVLLELAPEKRWTVAAGHVNYRLRDDDSDQDESFCRELCRRKGIRVYCSRQPAGWNRPGINVQAWARDVRYRFLERISDRDGYDWIAVGHHLGDRAETVAAAVLAAAGTFALSGIPPVRGRIIRPLFECAPEAIREFLRVSGIPFRLDRSNARTFYQRNRIRHKTIPAWTESNPSIVRGLARLGEQLWRQQSFLEKQATRLLKSAMLEESPDGITLDAARLSRMDQTLDPFVLRDLIGRLALSIVPTPSTVERFSQLRQAHGSGRVEQGRLIFERSKDKIAVTVRSHSLSASRHAASGKHDTVAKQPHWEIKTEVVKEASIEQFDDCRQVFLDLDQVHPPVQLRTLQAGDRYRPIGLNGTKKLLDLLADHQIPAFQRRQVPVLTDSDGILWPVGQPIADRAKITRKTRRILRVAVQNL